MLLTKMLLIKNRVLKIAILMPKFKHLPLVCHMHPETPNGKILQRSKHIYLDREIELFSVLCLAYLNQ